MCKCFLFVFFIMFFVMLLVWVGDFVVYYFDNVVMQGFKGLCNICNYLDVDFMVQIIVVMYVDGVDMLMDGVKVFNGIEFGLLVLVLKVCGVCFEVCEIILKNCGLKKEQFMLEVDYIFLGVVCFVKLQKEGYVYIKF